jgi:nuclear pore complex protein Nup133
MVLQNLGYDDGLELVFSQFSDAFAFSARGAYEFVDPTVYFLTLCFAEEPPYQEQLHLKNADDMLLGFCVLEQADGRDMLLLTTGMVLAARPNLSNIIEIKNDVQ